MTSRFGACSQLSFLFTFFFILFFDAHEVFAHAPHDDVAAILLSPAFSFDGTIFAIIRYSILRSIDFGYSWHRLTKGLGPFRYFNLSISPFFASDQCLFASSDTGGIFRSNDAGLSWVSINQGLAERCITDIATDATVVGGLRLIALGQSGHLYTSHDAGDHWHRVACAATDDISAAAFIDHGIVVGTHAGVIHISDDDGLTWRQVSRLQPTDSVTCFAPLDLMAPRSIILVGTKQNGMVTLEQVETGYQRRHAGLEGQHITSLASTRNEHGAPIAFATTWRQAIFRSEDAGMTWTHDRTGLTTNSQADEALIQRPHFKGIEISSAYADDKTLFLGGFDGVFKSTDGGHSWHEMRGALSMGLMVSLDLAAVDETHLQVACTTYVAGVYMRDSHGRWESNNVGMEEGRLFEIAFSPNFSADRTLFTVSNWMLFKSTDGGQRWHRTPLMGSARTSVELKAHAYTAARRVARTFITWFGRNLLWKLKQYASSRRAEAGISLPGFGAVLAISPAFQTDRTLFVGGRLGILRSRDGGATLRYVIGPTRNRVRSLVVSPNFDNDGTVFAAFDDGICRSTDGGTTWETVLQDPAVTFAKLAISPAYSRDWTVFIGSRSGLRRSRDGGRLWAPLHIEGLTDAIAVDGIAVSPCFQTDREILVHVCGAGLFRSRDGGDTFAAVPLPAAGPMRPSPAFSHMSQFPDRASLIKYSPHYKHDKTLYASSMEDIFKSADGGDSWEALKRPIRYENYCPNISYQGKWRLLKSHSFSSMSASCSSRPGATAVMEFVGEEIHWIGMHGPKQGMANVMIDGKLAATVDQYAAAPVFSQLSFEVSDLGYGPHTIVIEVIPERHLQSSGSTITIDAFDVT